jgi:Uncharacterised protein family (UPF0158)
MRGFVTCWRSPSPAAVAFRRFKDVLLDYPTEREAWFAFRDGHVRGAARDWLEEKGITPTTAPPRRRTT